MRGRQLAAGRPSDGRRANRSDADFAVEDPLEQCAQPPRLFVIDGAGQDSVRGQQRPGQQEAVVHQRQPGRVLEVILVQNRRRVGVVRRVRVDALHLAAIPRLQQVQRLEVLAVYEQAVGLFVERAGIGERVQQAVGEVAVEVARIDDQVRVGLEEIDGRRVAPGCIAVGQVAGDLVDGVEVDPLPALGGVGGDLRVEPVGNPVEGDAPVGLQHELLLEPEALLEVLELGEKVDDLAADVTGGPYAGEGPVEAGGVAALDVVEIQDVGVQVEVELAAEEAAEVLVDEVVEAVPGGVALEVLGEQRAVGSGLGGGKRRQQHVPVGIERPQDALDGGLVDSALLSVAVSGPSPLLGVGQGSVFETDDHVGAVEGDGDLAGGEHEAALAPGGLLDVVLLVVGRRDLEAHAARWVARVNREDVGRVVLGGLHVVLVRVSPVQLHLLAVVGDEVGGPAAAGVPALGDEVALGVIAAEEAGEMVVDVRLGVGVLLHLGETPVELDDRGRRSLVGVIAGSSSVRSGRLPLPGEVGALRVAGELQGLLDLRQQVVVEERHDLGRLQVHDAVQPEVEVAAVELEHLAQQRAEAVEVLPGAGGVRIQRGHGRWSFAARSSVAVVGPPVL